MSNLSLAPRTVRPGHATSIEIAAKLARPHDHVLRLVKSHLETLEVYGSVPFRIERGAGRPTSVAILSPPQIAFLIARVRSDLASRALSDFVASLPEQLHAEILDLIASIDIQDIPPGRFIYVARERVTGRYKIGISSRPESRVKELNLGNPEPLDIVAKIPAMGDRHSHESALHEQFSGHRLRSEWFDADTPVHEIENSEDPA